MTEQPDATRELDMSKVFAEYADESPPKEADVVAGEPGWEADTGEPVLDDGAQ